MRSYRVTRTEALKFGCTGLLLLLAAQLARHASPELPPAVVTTAPAFVFGVITASNALPPGAPPGLPGSCMRSASSPSGVRHPRRAHLTLLGPITGAALGLASVEPCGTVSGWRRGATAQRSPVSSCWISSPSPATL